jgi:lipopolysaccharide transport system ATP-binding protein
MSRLALDIVNVSKTYQIGTTGTGSLRQDINKFWYKIRGKTPKGTLPWEDREFTFEALQHINLQIRAGETWGLVGANGAGKSTLLKIISRIVRPSTGTVKGWGTLSSLLEIGTGFQPDLTGRENVYISGHTLGMSRRQITSCFDEIVQFSGVEKFIDTPVKRYSSGMYVRLAFAVAAHLEPDILVVDEVLAVGDAEFQKKCMSKMRQVSQTEGRTIIFVSHNSQAIIDLCQKAAWLHKGQLKNTGNSSEVVNQYLASQQVYHTNNQWPEERAPGNDGLKITEARLLANDADIEQGLIPLQARLTVHYTIKLERNFRELSIRLILYTLAGECIFEVASPTIEAKAGILKGKCSIPGSFLNGGSYFFSLGFSNNYYSKFLQVDDILGFTLQDKQYDTSISQPWPGHIRPLFPYQLIQAEIQEND